MKVILYFEPTREERVLEVAKRPAEWLGSGWIDPATGELWVVKRTEEKQSIASKVVNHPVRLTMDRPPSESHLFGTPHKSSLGFIEGALTEDNDDS